MGKVDQKEYIKALVFLVIKNFPNLYRINIPSLIIQPQSQSLLFPFPAFCGALNEVLSPGYPFYSCICNS